MRIVRSWLLPALLFFQCQSFANQSLQFTDQQLTEISEKPQWHALLHLRQSEKMIVDEQFILPGEVFSPLQQLSANVSLLNESSKVYSCRFPARFAWLMKQDGETVSANDFSHCEALSEYLSLVPFETLSVVFASEVLSSANSMMGHVFLRASGTNRNQNYVEHAISFFTEINSLNPFKVIYDGVYGGMAGFFIVRPYEKESTRYLEKENRNLFEYTLALDSFQRFLIQLHIWELKDIDITYLFQQYNCATLALYVLSISEPQLKQSDILFVSPADVVKAVAKNQLIDDINVNLSNQWLINTLSSQIDDARAEQILQYVNSNDESWQLKITDPLEAEFAYQLLLQQGFENSSERDELTTWREQKQVNQTFMLNLQDIKNPVDSLQDSIFSASVVTGDDTDLRLGFLPASHYLRTINHQYFSDSSLKIGEIVVDIDSDNGDVKLDRFTLYSARAHVPSTKFANEISGNFFLGYKQHITDNLRSTGFFKMQVGIGKTYQVHDDVLVYGLMNMGIGGKRSESVVEGILNLGTVLNLIGNAKLRFEYALTESNINDAQIAQWSGEFSLNVSTEMSVFLSARRLESDTHTTNSIELGLDYHF